MADVRNPPLVCIKCVKYLIVGGYGYEIGDYVFGDLIHFGIIQVSA